MVVMIAGIDLSQEIFAIDILRILKSSLKHRRKHVLRSLQIQQISLWLALFVGSEHDVSTGHLHVIGGITSSFIGLARVERCRHSTNL